MFSLEINLIDSIIVQTQMNISLKNFCSWLTWKMMILLIL